MPRIHCSALLIDMDGVLVDSTPAVARVWSRWAHRHNMDPHYVVAFAHGRTSLASIQELLPDEPPEIHHEENDWMERAEQEDVADVIALPGARQLLTSVPGSQRAVVTSASRPLAEIRLRAAGLWELVTHLVSATDVLHSKPDPEPYQKGAAVLQTAPDLCVVIEDAPSGTRAGKAAGARVLGLRTTTQDEALFAAGADWIANDCASIHITCSPTSADLLLELPAPR